MHHNRRHLARVHNTIQSTAEKMFSWSQLQRLRNKGTEEVDKLRDSLRSCKLNLFQQFYLFLHKLRLVHLTKNLQINLVLPFPQ